MFKYICYDLESDTLIATNDEVKGYCMINCPQQFEYFHSFKEAIAWLKNHPTAHQEHTEEIEKMYWYQYGDQIIQEKEQEYLVNNWNGDAFND